MNETWPCRNCGLPVFYSGPDCNFLHIGSHGNGYYCPGETIGGKSADPDKPREPYLPPPARDPEDIRAAVLRLPKRKPPVYATIAGLDHYDVVVASRVSQASTPEELIEKVARDLEGLIEDVERDADADYRAGTLPRTVARWVVDRGHGNRHEIRMERA